MSNKNSRKTEVKPEIQPIGGDDVVSDVSKSAAPVAVVEPSPEKVVKSSSAYVDLTLKGDGEAYSARNIHLSYESARTLRKIADGLGVQETDRALEIVLANIEKSVA